MDFSYCRSFVGALLSVRLSFPIFPHRHGSAHGHAHVEQIIIYLQHADLGQPNVQDRYELEKKVPSFIWNYARRIAINSIINTLPNESFKH